MIELLEALLEMVTNIDHKAPWTVKIGVPIVSFFIFYNKWKENRLKQQRNDEMRSDIKAIKNHLGVPECANTSTPSIDPLVTIARELCRLCLLASFIVLRVSRYTIYLLRRVVPLKKLITALMSNFSKKLAALIITIAVSALNEKFGLEISSDGIYGLYGLTLAYIAGQSAVDWRKAISKAANAIADAISESAATTDGSPISTITAPPMSSKEMLPYLNDITKELTAVYDALQSGRYNEQTQNAINIAMTIHDYLKQQSKEG